jgi:hypothetical protein
VDKDGYGRLWNGKVWFRVVTSGYWWIWIMVHVGWIIEMTKPYKNDFFFSGCCCWMLVQVELTSK